MPFGGQLAGIRDGQPPGPLQDAGDGLPVLSEQDPGRQLGQHVHGEHPRVPCIGAQVLRRAVQRGLLRAGGGASQRLRVAW